MLKTPRHNPLVAVAVLAVAFSVAACGEGETGSQDGQVLTMDVGIATTGGTSLPGLVIDKLKLDERHDLAINWVRLDQAELQTQFALGQFDVTTGENPAEAVRLRTTGAKVSVVYPAIAANVYIVTKEDAPYQEVADLQGRTLGLYNRTSSSTSALQAVLQARWGLTLDDFDLIEAPPPALVGLLDRGEIDAMVNVDPIVLKVLQGGGYRELMSLRDEWYEYAGGPLFVSALAAQDEYIEKNPEAISRLVATWQDAIDYILNNPSVYRETGFIETSGFEDVTPELERSFAERFEPLYDWVWNDAAREANELVFEAAVEDGMLEGLDAAWYIDDYMSSE